MGGFTGAAWEAMSVNETLSPLSKSRPQLRDIRKLNHDAQEGKQPWHTRRTQHTQRCKGTTNPSQSAYPKAQCPACARYPDTPNPLCKGIGPSQGRSVHLPISVGYLPLLLSYGGSLSNEHSWTPASMQPPSGGGHANQRTKLTTLCFPALQLNC